ncbi:DUF6153 family protein [Glycomyces sp. L485]|uniref:DUF6153 family protein n=1 Tax=Glycomyces sp. L485 TaxID=2909235 RepID=UPI001F4BAAF8|nr:DUF6153 family protein [Glycomyces sp. L485]
MLTRSRAVPWLVALATVVTLGHLINLHGHPTVLGHDDAHSAHGDTDCTEKSHHEQDGHEESCGLLLPPTVVDAAPTETLAPSHLTATATTRPNGPAETGPNGRAPPSLVSELQVNRI